MITKPIGTSERSFKSQEMDHILLEKVQNWAVVRPPVQPTYLHRLTRDMGQTWIENFHKATLSMAQLPEDVFGLSCQSTNIVCNFYQSMGAKRWMTTVLNT